MNTLQPLLPADRWPSTAAHASLAHQPLGGQIGWAGGGAKALRQEDGSLLHWYIAKHLVIHLITKSDGKGSELLVIDPHRLTYRLEKSFYDYQPRL